MEFRQPFVLSGGENNARSSSGYSRSKLRSAEALAWIARAQDHSLSADGGVARHYCLVTGWGTSYPETTGYIVPTIIREGTKAWRRELAE